MLRLTFSSKVCVNTNQIKTTRIIFFPLCRPPEPTYRCESSLKPSSRAISITRRPEDIPTLTAHICWFHDCTARIAKSARYLSLLTLSLGYDVKALCYIDVSEVVPLFLMLISACVKFTFAAHFDQVLDAVLLQLNLLLTSSVTHFKHQYTSFF